MNLFKRGRGREDGWLAISMQAGTWSYAHASQAAGRWSIHRCGTRALLETEHADQVAKELQPGSAHCLALLSPGDYQLLLVDAPSVPAAEMRSAVRWKVKDLLDYPVDEAAIEVLDIPPAPSARAHSVYAVSARNQTITSCIAQYEAARIPLSVIDIPETAQRNIAALFEAPDRALAFLHTGPQQALLTVNYRGELYLARRLDIGMSELLDAGEEPKERVLLEIQRSFDHFERQFPQLGIARLLLGPEPRETGLAEYLSRNVDVPVERAKLEQVLDFAPGCAQDPEALWRLFHVLGATLRPATAEAGALL